MRKSHNLEEIETKIQFNNMEEIQYVVPPEFESFQPEGTTPAPVVNLHKKQGKLLPWVKSHKILTAASSAGGLIVIFFFIVISTQQQVSLLGLQLNPLYNQANVEELVVYERPLVDPNVPVNTGEPVESPVVTPTPTPVEPAPVPMQEPEEPKYSKCADPETMAKLTAVYRLWNQEMADHLYTTDLNERPDGYEYEGISGYVFKEQLPNTVPIYRSSKADIGSHYYTSKDNSPEKYGYFNEGILGYAYSEGEIGTSAWFSLHKGWPTSDYIQTISSDEKTSAMELGYQENGIVAYICSGIEANLPLK